MIVKGCAGLGNRLITAFDAAGYAARNNRKLVIDWADGQFDEKHSNAFDKCFALKQATLYDIGQVSNWDQLQHTSALFKANRHAGVYDLFKEKHSGFYARFPLRLFPKGNVRKLRRRWEPLKDATFKASLNFGSDLKDGLHADVAYYVDFLPQVDYTALPGIIGLKPAIQAKVDAFSQAAGIAGLPGVHIRYTDKKPVKAVSDVIAHLKAQNITALFLATDAWEIEKLFSEHFRKVLLFSKFKPELKKEGLHQWALHNNATDLKYRMYEESVIEMFLLSQCRQLYYQGNSSFSTVAREYHTNKDQCFDWQKL